MREVILYIAMSLDGYIADKQGKVDWLAGQDPESQEEDSYSRFLQEIDTVIMGWNTYHQIVTELSPGQWVYEGLDCYVLTHRDLPADRQIHFTRHPVTELIEQLKQKSGKNIWICGGAAVVQPLIRANLIDRYDISIIPTILGEGISLFPEGMVEKRLRLTHTETANGIVRLIYSGCLS